MQETRAKDILGIFFGVTKMTILGWVLPPFSSLFPIQYLSLFKQNSCFQILRAF